MAPAIAKPPASNARTTPTVTAMPARRRSWDTASVMATQSVNSAAQTKQPPTRTKSTVPPVSMGNVVSTFIAALVSRGLGRPVASKRTIALGHKRERRMGSARQPRTRANAFRARKAAVGTRLWTEFAPSTLLRSLAGLPSGLNPRPDRPWHRNNAGTCTELLPAAPILTALADAPCTAGPCAFAGPRVVLDWFAAPSVRCRTHPYLLTSVFAPNPRTQLPQKRWRFRSA